ncbi:hypothetical protein [Sulfitobacter dubius]|uniref:hypothetical protein n=1 Tax=Sulfitobacter dubius TaxID=218673 RepID=UPI002942D1DE|nr:hypothetical protein [Sulfitobacter dubius]WOI28633.1 hypothetical protein R1T39_13220 [Sulfitobacter dubius]
MHDTNRIHDRRALPDALGQVESELRSANPPLHFHLVGQAHYGEIGLAFIEVVGIDDPSVCGQIREKANAGLEQLGFPIDLKEGKDVYHIMPTRQA